MFFLTDWQILKTGIGGFGVFGGRLFIIAALLCAAVPALGVGNYFAFDLGAYGSNLKERFSTSETPRQEDSTLSGFVRLRPGFVVTHAIYFEPSLGLSLPWRTSEDGSVKTFTSLIDGAFHFSLNSWFGLRAGPGLQWHLTVGGGDEVPLRNGTSTTTFYTPYRPSSVVLFTAFAGMRFRFSRHLDLGLDLYSSDVLSAGKRRYHGVVALGVTL